MEYTGIFMSQGGELSGMYSLGDIAVGSHSSPFYGMAVKVIIPDFLAALIGFEEVWMDEGSGARHSIAF